MKFLFTIVITSFFGISVYSQCPSNDETEVIIKGNGKTQTVVVKFAKPYEGIKELQIIRFGKGVVENARIRKKNNKEYIIESLESGEYMIQIVGNECTSYVGTNEDYQGFIIK